MTQGPVAYIGKSLELSSIAHAQNPEVPDSVPDVSNGRISGSRSWDRRPPPFARQLLPMRRVNTELEGPVIW